MKLRSLFAAVRIPLIFMLSAAALAPAPSWGCACGCNIFEVGTSAMLPTRQGGMVFLEEDFLNQNKNWSRYSRASDDDDPDKQIRTHFLTLGGRYLFNRSWGVMADLPYWFRRFKTTGDDGNLAVFDHSSLGDIRLRGIYSGLSEDMSAGLTFGVKLPTGDIRARGFDRDTQIGTGSTDLLAGAYRFGRLASSEFWAWFSHFQLDVPVLTAGGYRPGSEATAALGAYLDACRMGELRFTPLAQVIAARRWRDSGLLANSPDSGYDRLLLSPGFELAQGPYRIYADAAFPVYQYVNGNQLVASEQFKLNVSYAF